MTADRIAALIEEAARPIPLLWPLGTAVATDPLWDLTDSPFPVALRRARQVLGTPGLPGAPLLADSFRSGRITRCDLEGALDRAAPAPDGPVDPPASSTILERHDRAAGTAWAAAVDREVAKHCSAWVAGDPQTAGFFSRWRADVPHDRVGRRLRVDALLAEIGDRPEDAVVGALRALGLDPAACTDELTGQLARLPGWAAHAKWRSQWAAAERPGPALHLVDYLAVRLVYDAAAAVATGHTVARCRCQEPAAAAAAPVRPTPAGPVVGGGVGPRLDELDPETRALVWLDAYEAHYRDHLLTALDRADTGPGPALGQPQAQVVFCIDVRSEGLRRHLEAIGGYQTFGTAGFFGIPARFRPLGSDETLGLCPVLISATVGVTEDAGSATATARTQAVIRQRAAARAAADTVRKEPVTSYLAAEAAGFGLAGLAVLRTAAPAAYGRLRRSVRELLLPAPETHPVAEDGGTRSDTDDADLAEGALRAMGLIRGFAPLVVLCGHGSTTENNPYASALDCGACGAARGGTSARTAAGLLNRPAVRRLLAERGIEVPDATVFAAAEHDTASDSVRVYRPAIADDATAGRLRRVEADLQRAGAALAEERIPDLPGAGRTALDPAARSADWAQVQPEWGLARCAAFVVGPRRLTAGVDLQRRVFLHSYEAADDPDGTVLEGILAGPVVVAHWISAAYYHSTVAPETLGAGDKVAHNVVAGIGVQEGAGIDLRLGLPLQSVFAGAAPYHEPMRLLVLVAAPRDRIDAVIARSAVPQRLVDGEWVHLVGRDRDRFWLRRPGGGWEPWSAPAAIPAPTATAHPHTRQGGPR